MLRPRPSPSSTYPWQPAAFSGAAGSGVPGSTACRGARGARHAGTGHAARSPRDAGHGCPDRPGAVPHRVRAPTAADPPPGGRVGVIAGHPRRWPHGPAPFAVLVLVCPAYLGAVFVIVGHPRRMPPLLTHGHAGAISQRVLCPILWWWNGCRRCLFPALAHNHAEGWREGRMTKVQ